MGLWHRPRGPALQTIRRRPERTSSAPGSTPTWRPSISRVEALTHHAVWGLEAVKTGVFAPPALVGPMPFADLQAMIGQAEAALEAFTPDEVNSWAGKDLDIDLRSAA